MGTGPVPGNGEQVETGCGQPSSGQHPEFIPGRSFLGRSWFRCGQMELFSVGWIAERDVNQEKQYSHGMLRRRVGGRWQI